ncbi:MAG: R3H domain-containing nucleic acid-binding protein [Patescibacteria group bacterium]
METALIKDIIEGILGRLSVPAEYGGISEIHGGEILKFSVKTTEPNMFIGDDARVLMALNHLVKKIFEAEAERKNLKAINFIVDINDFQEKKIEDIKNKARMMAERARCFKNDVELPAMNPYERMIVHSFFTNTEDIDTESVGTGLNRRVILRFREKKDEGF